MCQDEQNSPVFRGMTAQRPTGACPGTRKALFLSLIVILSVCPQHREWRLRLPQDQDRSLILKGHTSIAGSPGGQRHRAEPLCSVLGSNIDRDDDLAGAPLRSPDIEGVVSADRWGQMIAP